MDGLEYPTPSPLPPVLDDMGPKKPGRPALDPAKRALNDARYAQMLQVIEAIPQTAKEAKFSVFRAMRHSDQKKDFKPLFKIPYKEYMDAGLAEEGALYQYVVQKLGREGGRFWVEATDPHGLRYDRVPHWIIPEGSDMPGRDYDEEFDDDEEDDEDFDDRRRRGGRPGFGRPRRRRMPEDGDDGDSTANVTDLLLATNKISHANASIQSSGAKDLVSLLMLTQSQQATSREDTERRREDDRRDERRREESLAAAKTAELREENRRRDEREDRARKEEADRRRDDDNRRQAEHVKAIEASNRRMELMMGGFTAAIPLISKFMEKKSDPFQEAMLAKALQPPAVDPLMGTLLKSALEKGERNGSSELMIEQVKQVMSFTNELNQQALKKVMDLASSTPGGQSEEGQDMLGKILGIVQGASEVVKNLSPAKPAPAAQPAPQRRPVHQPRIAPPAPVPAIAPAAQQTPAPVQPTVAPASAATPAQEQATVEAVPVESQVPVGMPAVLGAMRIVHQRLYQNQAEMQMMYRMIVEQMPLDVRVAIIEGDEMRVFQLVMPIIQGSQEFVDWIDFKGSGTGDMEIPATITWIRSFVPQLAPHLESMHGPLAQQKDELARELERLGLQPAPVNEQAVEAAVGQPIAEIPVVPVEPVPVEAVAAAAPVAAAEAPAPAAPAAPVVPAVAEAQLTDHDRP